MAGKGGIRKRTAPMAMCALSVHTFTASIPALLQAYAQARAQFTTSPATGWSEGTLHSEIPAGMCSCAQMQQRPWRPAMTSAGPGMQLSTTRLQCTTAECTACVAATATTSWHTSLSRSALQGTAPGTSRTLCAPNTTNTHPLNCARVSCSHDPGGHMLTHAIVMLPSTAAMVTIREQFRPRA